MSFEKLMAEKNPFELYESEEGFTDLNEKLKEYLRESIGYIQELRESGVVIDGENATQTVFQRFRSLSRWMPDIGQYDTASREAIEHCIRKGLEPTPQPKPRPSSGPSF